MLSITQRHQVGTYFVSFFSFGLIISTLGIALPYLAQHANVSIGKAALLFTMNSIGFLFGSLISGALYDVMKGKYLLAIAWLIASFTTYMLPILSTFFFMCILNILFGIANSTLVVGCNTLITRVDKEKTSSLLPAMHVVNGVGAFLTPVLFTLVIQRTGDVVVSYHIYSAFFLFLAIFVLFTPNHTMVKVRKSKNKDITHTRHANTLSILLLALMAFVYVGSEISFNGWIFTFMKIQFPFFGGNAGYVSAAFWFFMTLGRILFTKMGNYYTVRNLMLFTISGASIGLALIACFPSMFYVVWIGTALTGFFMGSIFPFMLSFGDQTIGMSGKLSGVLFAGTSFGGMLLPYVNGQIFEKFSPAMVMISILTTILITFTIFFILRIIVPQHAKEVKHISLRTVYEPPLITNSDK